MDIYINRRWIEIQKEEGHGILAFHQRSVIALAQCSVHHRTFDRTTVDEDELLRTCLPAQADLGDQTADSDLRSARDFYFEQAFNEFLPVQIPNSFPQTRNGRQLESDSFVANESKRDLRMTDRLQMKLVFDLTGFGIFGAQEFPARGQVIKK